VQKKTPVQKHRRFLQEKKGFFLLIFYSYATIKKKIQEE